MAAAARNSQPAARRKAGDGNRSPQPATGREAVDGDRSPQPATGREAVDGDRSPQPATRRKAVDVTSTSFVWCSMYHAFPSLGVDGSSSAFGRVSM